jgi:hypothetical protein
LKNERQDDNKTAHCKNEIEQIRDAHIKKLKDTYEQLKDTLSEYKAKNCTLNEGPGIRQSYELEMKNKDLEKAHIKLKNGEEAE